MAASQLELIVDQIKLLPPDELVKLIRWAAEILEQKQVKAEKPTKHYAAFFGAGKGVFATPQEADRFIRQERDAWEE
jgi:hypothetical protein